MTYCQSIWTDAEIQAQIEKLEQEIGRYKQELERRKHEVPLGVPSSNRVKTYYYVADYGHIKVFYDDDDELDKCFFDIMNYFSSEASAQKHSEMLLAWRKALVANAKGEPIDIEVLLPLLPKGWVAMDGRNNTWFWYNSKPEIGDGIWKNACNLSLAAFNIKPAEDWRESLMECGL